MNTREVVITYTNHRGETADRRIMPVVNPMWWGTTEYHPLPQWFVKAVDLDRNVQRDFAMNDIHSWKSPKIATT